MRDKSKRDAGGAGQVSASSGGSDATSAGARGGRKWKRATAAAIFVLTPVTALIVQDLYNEAKTTVRSDPFSVAIAPYDECPNGEWLFPADFDLRTLPGFDRLDSRWAYEHGGYSVGQSAIDLTLQADGSESVVLRRMRVLVTERRALAPGVVISKCPAIRHSALDAREFEINLDDPDLLVVPRSSAREELDAASDNSPYFRGFPYKISERDPEEFLLLADTESCLCSWRAQLDWAASGRSGTTTLDFSSTPFRTSPKEPAARSYYYYERDGTLRAGS